jgi:chaperone modulatory protein CbpM
MATEQDDTYWIHAHQEVTLVELAESSGLSEEMVRELVEFGAITPASRETQQWIFSGDCVVRVRRAARLQRDLELETPALALVLSFLERIDRLEGEMRLLGAQLPRPRR